MLLTFLLIAQRKLSCIFTKINFKAAVMRDHMHTQLKVRVQNDFGTVTLNDD